MSGNLFAGIGSANSPVEQFEEEAEPRKMIPGDWITIEAHRRHRVNWTDPAQPTVWLAIHYR